MSEEIGMGAEIVSLHKGAALSKAKQDRADREQKLVALLRRAEVFEPWGRVSVNVFFDTPQEADLFQELVHANRRRRRRK